MLTKWQDKKTITDVQLAKVSKAGGVLELRITQLENTEFVVDAIISWTRHPLALCTRRNQNEARTFVDLDRMLKHFRSITPEIRKYKLNMHRFFFTQEASELSELPTIQLVFTPQQTQPK
ncbi:hypothetical protein [Iodobacter fluviatilis]|uniref:Uncharacterized protein n=1 Tax=Iodobacter fluviatilis TaxID=537 RepID=A0A7G3GFC3_9NEIS|nr:hypothetical protein [Iodobacter fluviatilis]QBC45884.1 hypothetical protein C1H71_20285 [Iodobacter fluviatilis]